MTLSNSGANDVSINDNKALVLAASSVGQNLFVTANGAISQTGALTVPGTASFSAGANAIDLSTNGASNSFIGAVTLSNSGANNVSIIDNSALQIASATVGGNLTLVSNGAISQSGAISAQLLTINSVGGAILNSANTITSFNATNATSGDIDLTNSSTGTLLVTGIAQSSGLGNVNITNTGTMTISGAINTTGGNVSLNTLTPDSSARVLTINGGVNTNGGAISASTANPNDVTALVDNGILNTGTGTGGVLSIGGGVNLNASPVVGAGSISLQGNGDDLTLGTVNLTSATNFSVIRNIIVTGALSTTGAASNLGLYADDGGIGVGGVRVTSTGSVNSSAALTMSGSTLTGVSGAAANTAIEVDNGGSLLAAGNISLVGNAGSGNILLNGATQTTGMHSAISMTTTSTAATSSNIFVNGNVTAVSGDISAKATGNVTLNGGNLSTNGNVSLTSGGAISEMGTNYINGAALTTVSALGTSLGNANTITSFNATDASGGVSLVNTAASLQVSGISEAGMGNVAINNTGAISLTGSIAAGSNNNVTLTSTGTVAESGSGLISGNLLTISSVGGETLNGANAVSSFNAGNTTSGDVQLTNTGSLMITGISQVGGGSVLISNSGALRTNGAITTGSNGSISLTATNGTETFGSAVTANGSGTVTLNATGASSDILVNANVGSTSGNISATAGRNVTLNGGNLSTSGNVALTAAAGAINESSTNYINGAALTTVSALGTSLGNANTVASFNATDASGGVSLVNTAASLQVSGISEAGTGNVAINNTGAISLTGSIAAGSNNNVTLTSTGTVAESGSGLISGNLLTVSSVGGETLNGTNAVSSFNAGNTTSGDVQLTNTGTLMITGINQVGGGNVLISNSGALRTNGAITTGSNGSISLTATNGTETFGSAVTANGSGTVTLNATGASSDILVNANVGSTSGNISATAGRNVTLNGGNLSTSGNVALTATAGAINESSTNYINGAALTTVSALGTSLGNANTVASFNATDASGGVSLVNTAASLLVSGISETGAGNVAISNTGAISLTGSIAAGNNNNVTLTSTGTVAEGSSGLISGNLLTVSSVGGETLNGANAVSSFNAGNTTSGDVQFTNTGTLTITGINQTGGGNIIVGNNGALSTNGAVSTGSNGYISLIATGGTETFGSTVTANGSGTVTLQATGATSDILINGNIGSTSGAISASAGRNVTLNGGNISTGGDVSLTAGAGAISEMNANFINGATLATVSATGTNLASANTVTSFNASNGTSGINLVNTAGLLTVGAITEAGAGNITVTNSGALTTNGAISTGLSGNILLAATGGTETLGSAVTANGAGTVTLNATGASSDILVNATVGSTSGNIQATAGRNITLNGGNISTSGNVALTASAGAISELSTSFINGAALTTISATGTTLNNNNTVTGFNANNSMSGDIQLANTSSVLTVSGISEVNGGNVIINNTTGSINLTNAVNGAFALSLTGNAGVTLGAALGNNAALTSLNVTGTTTINSGVVNTTGTQAYNNDVILGSATSFTGGNILLGNIDGLTSAQNLTIHTTGASNISGSIGGNIGALSVNANSGDTGTLTLASANSYSGNTTLGAGVLSVGNNSALSTGSLTLNGGSIQAANNSGIVLTNNFAVGASSSGIGGTNNITLSGNGTLNANSSLAVTNAGTTTLSGSLTGAGALSENTTGMLSIGGVSTANHGFSGDITLTSGKLQIASDVNADPLGTGHLYVNGGTILASTAVTTNSIVNAFTVGAGDTMTLSGANSMVFSGAGILNNNSSITDNGSNGNSFTGGIALSSLASATESINVGNGETLTISGNPITGGSATNTLNVNTNTTGILALDVANTYSGATSLNGGSITFGVNNALPTGTALTDTGAIDLAGYSQQLGSLTGSGSLKNSNATTAAALTLNNSNADTLNTLLSGNLSLTEINTGVLTLAAANTYSGATNINANGTLALSGAGAVPTNSALILATGSNFNLNDVSDAIGSLTGTGSVNLGAASATVLSIGNDNTSTTYNGSINGSGGITKVGTGTLTMDAANSYAGATTINNGILSIGVQGAIPGNSTLLINSPGELGLGFNETLTSLTGSGNILLTNGVTLTVDNSSVNTYSGVLQGTGNLIVDGSQTLTLSGHNTYSGSTTIASGSEIALGIANALPTTTTLTVNGILDLAGNSQQLTGIAGTNGEVTNSITGQAATFTLNNNSVASSFSGLLAGNMAFADIGTGALTLTHANTYTGATAIASGSKIIDGIANALPTTTILNDSGILDLSGFSQQIAGLSGVTTGSVTNSLTGAANLATFTLNTGTANTFAGLITGNMNFTVSGTGSVNLQKAETYTGTTTISNGSTIFDGVTNALPTSATTGLLVDNGTLDLNGFSQQLASVTGSGIVTNSNAAQRTFTLKSNISDTFNGSFTGNLALTLNDTNQVVLNGVSTYSGATTLTSGLVVEGASGALANNTALSIGSGILWLGGFSQTVSSLTGNGFVDGNTGNSTLTINNATANTYNGIIENNLSLVAGGSAALTLMGANSYNGSTTINSSSTINVDITNALPTGTTLVNNGTLNLNGFSQQVASISDNGNSGVITNSSGIAQTFTVTNSGNNTFDGSLTGNLGLVKSNGGTLTLTNTNTYTGQTSIVGGTLAEGVNNALPTNTILANSGTLDLAGFTQQLAGISGTGIITNSSNAATAFTLNSGVANSFAGAFTGNLSLTTAGVGTTLTLNGVNSYTGATTISTGTSIALGIANALPTTTVVTDYGTLNLFGNSQQLAGITSTGTVTNSSSNAAIFTISNNTTADSFAGSITGNLALAVNGGNMLTLSGANTYSGATSISNGSTILAGINNALPVGTSLALSGAGTFDTNGFTQTIANASSFDASGVITNSNMNAGTFAFNNSSADAFSGAITGNLSLTANGSAALTLAGVNSYIGATTISTGSTIMVGVANALPTTTTLSNSGTLNLNGFSQQLAGVDTSTGIITNSNTNTPVTLILNNAAAETLAMTLTGNLGLSEVNSGALTLAAANTYMGATTLSSGSTLALSGNGAVPANSALIMAAGSNFNLNDVNDTIGSFSGFGNINLGVSGATTLTTHDKSANGSYSGVISGAGGLTMAGTGNFSLMTDNTYTGVTSINSGTLTMGSVNAIPAASILNINGSGTLGGLDTNKTFGGLEGNGTLNLTSGISLTINNNTNNTFSGTLSGTGNLIKQGSGILTLNGNDTYSGNSDIQAGILNIANPANVALGTMSVESGAELEITNTTLNSALISLNGTGIGGAGALVASGTVNINSNISLTGNSAIGTLVSADALTLNGTVEGNKGLTVNGAGTTVFNGTIGANTALSSFTSNSALTINGGSVTTSGNQTYNSTVNATGNIMFNAATVNINGGSVTSTGSQMYNAAVVLGADAILTTGANMSLGNGVSGGKNLTLIGSTGNNNFALTGNLAVSNLTVTGSNAGNNTLTVRTNDATQSWTINAANAGNISGIAEMNGAFNFTGVQNLVGGNNANVFTLNGGTLAGSITGGSGTNTLVGDNVVNTWNITATNSGYVNGVNSFSKIQNLTGGNKNNTFIFADQASVTGTLNAGTGSLENTTNTLDYSAYLTPITMTVLGESNGVTQNNSSTFISNFTNVNNLKASGDGTIVIAASNKVNTLHITGSLQGYINDPLVFTGVNKIISPFNNTQVTFDVPAVLNMPQSTATVNGGTITFVNFQSAGFGLPEAVEVPNEAPVSISNQFNLLNSNGAFVDVNSVIAGAHNNFNAVPGTSYTDTSVCSSTGSATVCGEPTSDISGLPADNSVSVTNFVIDNLSDIFENNKHHIKNAKVSGKKNIVVGLSKPISR